MDFDTQRIVYKILDQIVIYVFYGIGIFASMKAYLMINGLKIYSFVRFHLNKKKFYKHNLFTNSRDIVQFRYSLVHIKSIPRKEIANEILLVEITRIRRIAMSCLNKLGDISLNSLNDKYNTFDSFHISSLFVKEFISSESQFKEFLRKRITRNKKMTREDFETFYTIYDEYTKHLYVIIQEIVSKYSDRKNIYATIFNILDELNSYCEILNKCIPNIIQIMNGRLSGLKYDGKEII